MKTLILNNARIKEVTLKGASRPFQVTSYYVWIEDSQTGQKYKMVTKNNSSAYFDARNFAALKELAKVKYHKTIKGSLILDYIEKEV